MCVIEEIAATIDASGMTIREIAKRAYISDRLNLWRGAAWKADTHCREGKCRPMRDRGGLRKYKP